MKYFTKISPSFALIVLLLTVLFFSASQSAALDSPVEPDTGFEIEGNTAWDHIGDYDWENAGPGVVHFLDPNSKAATDPTTFRPDGKFDKPQEWSILPGNVGPSQNELTNTAVWAIRPGELGGGSPKDFWLIMAMERTKKEGTFFLDFEYNQMAWDGSSGGLTRTRGDLVVGFELKGNPIDRMKDLRVLIVQYFPNEQPQLCKVTPGKGNQLERVELGSDACPAYGDSGFYYRYLADGAILSASTLGQATMNENPFKTLWPSTDAQGKSRDTIGPFEFAEAAINLTALGVEPTCSTFSSAHAKTRSSLEPNADLKDLVQPAPISTNCRLDGHKFLDIDGDGVWDQPAEPPLEGWQIKLSGENGADQSTVTDADGYYEFEYLADDSYTVSEVCPDDWVQTAPGMTDFANCGAETYTVDINIHNREENDLDFGNGSPAIEVDKSCPADVFLGDDVMVTITVGNTGNVNLYDVSVVDEMIGLNEMITRLTPGQVKTFKGSYVATEPTGDNETGPGGHLIMLPLMAKSLDSRQQLVFDPVTNIVEVAGQYAAVEVSDSDSCTTEVHKLTVSKDAQTSYTRQYLWSLDKEAEDTGLILLYPGQTATVGYTITVDLAQPSSVVKDWAVRGEITIDNPAPMDAQLSAVTDVVAPDLAAEVECPSLTVPAQGSLTCTYGPLALPNGNPRTNTATAILINNNGNETEFEGSIPFDFENAEVKLIDASVDIFDSNLVTEDNKTGFVGTVSYAETLKSFTYTGKIGPFLGDACQAGDHENIATLKTSDTGTEIRATASVPYLCFKTITVAFEDLPHEANDWDYNDIVLDINPVLTYSDDGDLLRVSFTIEQGGEYAAYTHVFSFQPTAFACDGTYTRKISGVVVDDQVSYQSGDNIVVIDDSGWTPEPVELTIDFDVSAPGSCPLDLSDPQFNLIGKFHGQGLFFAPWILVNDTGEEIRPGDVRLINIPDDWTWPSEKTPIWQCYPNGVTPPPAENPSAGPSFSELWWQADNQCRQ